MKKQRSSIESDGARQRGQWWAWRRGGSPAAGTSGRGRRAVRERDSTKNT